MTAYYNEHDPKTAAWLRELIKRGLIADGEVDERSIEDVKPEDVRGFTQIHFFAGIGGWSYALRLAGWQDERPVWTGSCPCQPFSSASRGRRTAVDMWPHMRWFIAERAPRVVFGEQVASARAWFDAVCHDMEEMGYSVGASILPACSVGKDHIRRRIYFACHSDRNSEPVLPINAKVAVLPRCEHRPERATGTDGVPARLVRLRGYGNAIVPQVAAEFVKAFCEVTA